MPVNQSIATHAVGAAIGTPNTKQSQLTKQPKQVYNLVSGSLIISIGSNSDEADSYQIGEQYVLSVEKAPKGKASKEK